MVAPKKEHSTPAPLKTAVPVGPKKPRPYWYVDAKWMLSLVLCVVLGAWLMLMVAHRATSREIGVDLMTRMVTLGIVQNSEVDQKAVDELRRKIAESPTKSIQPIPGFPVKITEKDLELPPQELVDRVFRQVTEPLYDKGARKFAQEQTSDKAQQDKFVKDASLVGVISKDGHERIGKWVLIVGVIVVVLMAGVVWFSHGFGRLVTPGIVLLLVSLPGLIVFSGLHAAVSKPSADGSDADVTAQLFAAGKDALLPLITASRQLYITAALIGLGLLIGALLGKLIRSIIVRRRKADIRA